MMKFVRRIPFSRNRLNYFEVEWITCGCIYKVRKRWWKDYCDFVDIECQKRISHSVTFTSGNHFILACHGRFKCTQLHIHTSCPSRSQLLFWNVSFGNSLSELYRHEDICSHFWLLLIRSEYREVQSIIF